MPGTFTLDDAVAALIDVSKKMQEASAILNTMIQRASPPKGPARGVLVRGGVQGAISSAAAGQSAPTMLLAAFIDKVMEFMPEADEGKRDTRRQNVARAIRSWNGKADAPLSIQGELVVFHE